MQRALCAVAVASAAAAASAPLPCLDEPPCASWVAGDASNCSLLPGLLRANCPLSCGACEEHEPSRRCGSGGAGPRLAPSAAAHDAIAASVLASSRELFGDGVRLLREAPQLVEMDGFLTADEAAELIDLAEATGFDSSRRYIDGDASLRTSSTVFCRGACQWSPAAARFVERIASATNVSAMHFEPVQFVRYRSGERYAPHSDFITADVEAAYGPRLLTFFVYLSEGFEGGGTAFPQLGLAIEPKVGRAAVWTNSMMYVGGRSGRVRWLPDSRAEHEAQPVGGEGAGGVKYGANIWIHDGPYRLWELYAARCRARDAPGGPGDDAETLEL